MNDRLPLPCWEHFEHGADIGIRGMAATLEQAFEQAALAMTAVISDLDQVSSSHSVAIDLDGTDAELLFFSWINELIYQMAVSGLLFGRFQVSIHDGHLSAKAFGEPIDSLKHQPAVEIKGATFTELRVCKQDDGSWLAQCVVDV